MDADVITEQLKLLSLSQYISDGAESLMYLPGESTQPKPTRNLPNRCTEKAQSHSYSVTEKKTPKSFNLASHACFSEALILLQKYFFYL